MTGFIGLIGSIGRSPGDVLTAKTAGIDGLTLAPIMVTSRAKLFCTVDLPHLVSGGITIVGDVLAEDGARGIRPLRDQRSAGLSSILEAYKALETSLARVSPEHHFILWDEEKGLLLASRDELGVRPIFYFQDDSNLAVASGVRFLVAAGVPEVPDQESVARFVVNMSPHVERTFLQNVRRLVPGNEFRWTAPKGVSTSPCANPSETPPVSIPVDATTSFREIFFKAVRERMGEPQETVSLLSGGLDSSSIALLAAKIAREAGAEAPQSYSVVFDATPEWSERVQIEAVAAAGNLVSRFFDIRDPDPLADFSARLAEHGGLFFGPGLYLGRRLHEAAASAGAKIVLDGHGGDEVVSHGPGRLHDMAMAGDWRELWSELKAGQLPGEPGPRRMLTLFWLRYGPLQLLARMSVRLWRAGARRAVRRSGERRFELASVSSREVLEAQSDDRADPDEISADDFETRRHRAMVGDPGQSMAMETIHAAGSALGLVVRFPFWDRDLVKLCLSLPADMKRRSGYGRWILREAVWELPDTIRWRRDKLDFSPHLALGLYNHHGGFLRELAGNPSAQVWRYADRRHVRRLVDRLFRLKAGLPGDQAQALWRVAALSLWLRDLSARRAADGAQKEVVDSPVGVQASTERAR